METDQFLEALNKLNVGQKEAVDAIEGPVMVVAGPGTGKTQVLTVRIANILRKTQVDPGNILALTFTESAAQNMRLRLAGLIGTPAYKVEIATFHGFANRIIQDYPEEFPGLVGAKAVTELEQIEILEEVVMNEELVLLRPFGDQLYYVKPILGAINELKKEGVRVEDLETANSLAADNFGKIADLYHEKGQYKGQMKAKYVERERSIAKNKELAVVFRKYSEELAKRRLYDFADMLIEVLAVMEQRSGLLLGLQERYQYILVDEHQDTNNAQNKIVELLASFYAPNPNLFVVGDEKQAIFRFQGATIENFLYFKKLYPGAKLINLMENYRSSQTILDAAGSLIRQNVAADVLVEKSSFLESKTNHLENKIGVVELSRDWMEGLWIASRVEELISEGEGTEIAIIVRQNKDFERISRALRHRGIRFTISSRDDVVSDKWVDQLLTIMRVVRSYDDLSLNSDWLVTRLLHFEIFGIEPMSVYKLLRERAKRRTSLLELLDDPGELKKLNLVDLKKLTQVANLLKKWVVVASNETLERLFIDIFNDSGLLQRVLGLTNSLEILGKFKSVFEDMKKQLTKDPTMGLGGYIGYLELLRVHNIGIETTNSMENKNSVKLMTAHKAKGLEFDVVFIGQCVDGHWGNSRKRARLLKLPWEELSVKLNLGVELEEIEDERRLFYVAMTRARKQVFLSYAKLNDDGKEQLPCQFIGEIEDTFRENINVTEFEREMGSHVEVIFEKTATAQAGVDKEYLQNLFREQGLSATSLGNYLECPWKYFYRNLLQLPDVKNKYMVFGSAIHLAISKYIMSVKSENRLTLGQVKKLALDYLEKESLTERDRTDLSAKCSRALDIFYEERMKKWDDRRESELRVRGVKLSDEVVINGVIDMIEPCAGYQSEPGLEPGSESGLEPGSPGKYLVRVTDFKTGRVKSRGEISDDEGDYNYQRQLTFYKLLLDNYAYKKMKVSEGVIDFVEADDKGRLHREVFEISDEEAGNLKNVVLGVADEIMNLKFWDKYCDKEGCEYCSLRKLIVNHQ